MSPRPLELDYLVPPRRPLWPGLVVLGVSLAVATWLFLDYRKTQVELARLEALAGLAGPERRAVPAVPKERVDEEVKRAEAVVKSLTLPWAGLVRSVEQAAMREVAILQLEPNPEARTVRLSAEAKTREAMFEYLRRLGAAGGVAEVHLVSHQVSRDDPQRPLQFSVRATMKAPR